MRAALALLLGLVGCGPNSLEGSLTDIVSLQYTHATVTSGAGAVKLQFIDTPNDRLSLGETHCPKENVVLELDANVAGLTLAPGAPVDLTAKGPDGAQRGRVSRIICNAVTPLPSLYRGQLTLNTLPARSGQRVSGYFTLSFVEGTSPYDGRTAFKSFEAQVP